MRKVTPEAYLNRVTRKVAGLLKYYGVAVPHRQRFGPYLYTVADLATRYGMSKTAMRKKVIAGEFGEIVHIGKRCYCVTGEGVRQFEAAHTWHLGQSKEPPSSDAPGGDDAADGEP